MAKIVVFAFDLTESAQIRRIKSLLKLGHSVTSFAFRRFNMNVDFEPDWPNTDLGHVSNENHIRRLASLLRALPSIVRNRRQIAAADVIVARNFDLLALAWLSRLCFGKRDVPLVYECLDIHGLFIRRDAVGALMRWAERGLLLRVQLLVISSPGFWDNYFTAIQGYRGKYSLIENKLWFDGPPPPRPKYAPVRDASSPLVLGWVGSIRCAPSLALLIEAAEMLGPKVEIRIHGNIHRHALPNFDKQVSDKPNVKIYPPYAYPDDLAAIYASCDLVWAQDLWQRGANSDWLLPNRIYEASWFGCPSVAVSETETGRRVARDKLGRTIPEPSADALVALLMSLDRCEISELSQGLLDRNSREFRLLDDDVEAAFRPVLAPE